MSEVPWKPNRTLIAYFFFAGAVGLLFIIVQNIVTNGASESAVLLGLSTERLALLGGILIIAMGLGFVGAQTLHGKFLKLSKPDGGPSIGIHLLLVPTLLVFLAAWVTAWTPAERFGTSYYYLERLAPLIIWLTCFSAVGLFLLLAHHFGLDVKQFTFFLHEQRNTFLVAGAALITFVPIAIAVASRVVNMGRYEEDFWYGAGVPLLVMQVLFAVSVSVGLALLTHTSFAAKNFEKKFWFDLVIFAAIWAVAAILWVQEPVNPDFFITKPAAPNYELYPDYDAEVFDIYSQFALIGQGLNWAPGFYDRPLYSALLVYLHTLAGQNYLTLIAWQAALFAIFPALGYILGKQLHSRPVGVGLAVLLTLRGINSIQLGPFINTAHQKQMMTDFPTAILIMTLTLLLIRWLQEPAKNWTSLAWAAGVLGLATLVRPHPLIYIPFIIALIIWVYRSQKRLQIIFSGLVLVAALAGVLPWVISNGNGQSVMDLYLQKIKSVIETRYPQIHFPDGSTLPPSTQVVATRHIHFRMVNPTASQNVGDKSVLAFTFDHFLNNLTTSVQTLPYSPYNQNLLGVTKVSDNFWKPYWNGAMSPWAQIILPFNLILLALGLASTWKRTHGVGLIPLFMMLGYFLMNALARTSGGRYIVPADWVVIVYYFLGLVALIEIVSAAFSSIPIFVQHPAQPTQQTPILFNRAVWLRISGIILAVLLIGTLIPLSSTFFERRYPPLSKKDLRLQVTAKASTQLGLTSKEWQAFLSSPQSIIMQGRILYPRQFEKDEGPAASIYDIYIPKPYPRMVFALIGPNGMNNAMLAAMQAPNIPNASDAIILGCRESTYIQVWGILVNDGDQFIKRTPATAAESLLCPLQEPVCDNNHHCR